MSERFCCDNLCEQGRDCPVRNQPIIPKPARELMQMALDAMINALAGNDFDNPYADMKQAVKALRDRLAQLEYEFECPRCGHCCQQREWVGLTDDEVMEIYVDTMAYDAVRVAEALLREKNT